MRLGRFVAYLSPLLFLFACAGPQEPAADASSPDARGDASGCTDARQCDDGVFCNGVERCLSGACAPGALPCPTTTTCQESQQVCASVCGTEEDADGDGVDAVACGGDDCDDADPLRAPGLAETCDPTHDEDCDPTTLGDTDADTDGFVAAACCNGALCGDDCDDALASVHPGATEACNGRDDDCDGAVDESVQRAFFPDADHDGFGDRDAVPTFACTPPAGAIENALDCDDTRASVSPARAEICNGVDDDCSGVPDEDPDAAFACTASFGSPPHTVFGCSTGSCTIASCTMPYGDCDGDRSNGCESDLANDPLHCGDCGVACGAGGACFDPSTGMHGDCDDVVQVAAGNQFTCVRRETGIVACWGGNQSAQLGDRTTTDRLTPVVVRDLADAVDLQVQRFTTAAVPVPTCAYACARTPSYVWCWGCNMAGTMGDGTSSVSQPVPGPVPGLPGVRGANFRTLTPQLAVGGVHACGGEGGGGAPSRLCWGSDVDGELGRGSVSPPVPQAVGAINLPAHDEAPIYAGWRHTCALVAARGTPSTAYCWGLNSFGQLGTGATSFSAAPTPTAVAGTDTYVELALGTNFTCGRTGTGTVRCWGGILTNATTPTLVAGVSSAVGIAAGIGHACALLDDGRVVCWGNNASGQLGDGTTATPTGIVTVAGLGPAAQVSAGNDHTCALLRDGTVWCWGANQHGQLGDGTTTPHPSPVEVRGL
ncbi:MAG: MopE-related protein [Sandaracinus sp.]